MGYGSFVGNNIETSVVASLFERVVPHNAWRDAIRNFTHILFPDVRASDGNTSLCGSSCLDYIFSCAVYFASSTTLIVFNSLNDILLLV